MRKYQREPCKTQGACEKAKTAKSRIYRIDGKNSRINNAINNRTNNTINSRINGIRMDYSIYHFSSKELLKYLAFYLLLDICVSYLFFDSWIAFAILLPGIFLFLKERRDHLQKKRAKEISRQFTDGMQMVTASLQAGYSIENALSEARKELEKVYEKESFIVQEFQFIEIQIAMNRNIEELFMDLGRRTAIEDILSFSEVFMTAKRSGGDLVTVIRNTISCIRQKQETVQEIETSLAGKVMEQNIMSMIPMFILAYIKLTSPDFIRVMYGNLVGTTIMAICFGMYILAYFWGRKIVRIEV